jgi:hypothetical protein
MHNLNNEHFTGRCVFEPSKVQGACFVIDDERNCERKQIKLRSRSSIHIQCEKGYTLFVSGKEVKDRGEITCVKGSYPDFNCTASKKKKLLIIFMEKKTTKISKF